MIDLLALPLWEVLRLLVPSPAVAGALSSLFLLGIIMVSCFLPRGFQNKGPNNCACWIRDCRNLFLFGTKSDSFVIHAALHLLRIGGWVGVIDCSWSYGSHQQPASHFCHLGCWLRAVCNCGFGRHSQLSGAIGFFCAIGGTMFVAVLTTTFLMPRKPK